jgi:hypothetical protein
MPTPPTSHNLIINAIGNTVPDCLALLTFIAATGTAYALSVRRWTHSDGRRSSGQMWLITRWGHPLQYARFHRRTIALLCAAALAQSLIWLGIVDHFAYAWDYPGSWCWTCTPILDMLGETTENCLVLAALGLGAGLAVGVPVRLYQQSTQRYMRNAQEDYHASRD